MAMGYSAPSDGLAYSPFEADLGWQPRSPLDQLNPSVSDIESINSLKSRLTAILQEVRFALQFSKARAAAYQSQKSTPATYVVGDSVWLSKKYFKDAVAKSQPSQKLAARRYGPFRILELIGKNALRLEFPSNIRAHPIVHVEHTTKYIQQPPDIGQALPIRPTPVIGTDGFEELPVASILRHRRRGKGYQWLTLYSGTPQHEARWLPTTAFIDDDGTTTEAFQRYIKQHHLLPNLH